MKIELRKNLNPEDALDQALKILKKKTIGLLKELREKRYYFKPSEIEHQKHLKLLYDRKRKKKR